MRLAREAMAKVVLDSRSLAASQAAIEAMPAPHVSAMACALADSNHDLAEDIVSDLLGAGVSVQDLCLDHLAPAARELGLWWERDKMPFADVTLATARIQSILRTIPASRARATGNTDKGALFAAVPGETHTLGVIMAADHFRRLGWDVGLLIGMDHDELCRRVADDDRRLIGLSCGGRHSAKALRALVDAIRWQRPDMAIVTSGQIVMDATIMESMPYLDGVVTDLQSAEGVLCEAAETLAQQQMSAHHG